MIEQKDRLERADLASLKADAEDRLARAREAVGPVEKEKEIAANREMERIIEELIAQKEKFSCVFRATSGSVYFVIPSGEVWRIKKSTAGYESMPIHVRIVFTNETGTKRIEASVRQLNPTTGIIGVEIPKTPFAAGATPVEFGSTGADSEVIFEENAEAIKFLGTRYGGELNDETIEGFHFGHPIAEILHQS